jgi:hypothetical protein
VLLRTGSGASQSKSGASIKGQRSRSTVPNWRWRRRRRRLRHELRPIWGRLSVRRGKGATTWGQHRRLAGERRETINSAPPLGGISLSGERVISGYAILRGDSGLRGLTASSRLKLLDVYYILYFPHLLVGSCIFASCTCTIYVAFGPLIM